MKKIVHSILILSLVQLFFLTSCASNRSDQPKLNKVFVTNTTPVEILPTDAIKESLEQYQLFEGDFGKNSLSSMLYLQADSTQITVVLLNEFGIEMGSIYYDGMSATLESSIFPKNFKCEYILLDLQNAYADSDALKAHYKKYGLDFVQENNRRTVSKKGKLIEEITTDSNQTTIKNHLRGYTYKLTVAE